MILTMTADQAVPMFGDLAPIASPTCRGSAAASCRRPEVPRPLAKKHGTAGAVDKLLSIQGISVMSSVSESLHTN